MAIPAQIAWAVLSVALGVAGDAVADTSANSVPSTRHPSKTRPNIVLFFVDDLGWGDLGFRNPAFDSPNIDRLARTGVSFDQAYVPTPTCSPSRATLLTGKHPARLGLVRHIPHGAEHGFDALGRPSREFNHWPGDPARFPSRNWLPLEHTTYAEALGGLGYENLFVGKWHLGHEPHHPVHQGFDRQRGVTNWGHPRSYYPPWFKGDAGWFKGAAEQAPADRYLTDKLTDDAIELIRGRKADRPFMLSLWYYSAHGPHVGRRDLVERFEAKGLRGRRAHYAAMVAAVDESVGRVRRALADGGLDENTVVIFLSDQGSLLGNDPLRGGKRVDTLCEGGARVPLIVHWPGVTRAGKDKTVVQSTDLFPTLIEIAGGSPEQFADLDGHSLLPLIRGEGPLVRGPLIGYRAYEDLYASVRSGDWKLLAYRSGKTALHDLASDPGEQRDLAQAKPEITRRLTAALAEWEREVGLEAYSGVQ